jgi:phosphate transport system protein
VQRHFETELAELKERLLSMGALAEMAVKQAMHAVLEPDEAAARFVLDQESTINAMQMEIDERVTQLATLRQFMAADLRLVLGVSRMNADLERIGDQAVNIAESALRLQRHPGARPVVELGRMNEVTAAMLHDSLQALSSGDVALAQSVLHRDDHLDRLRDQIFRELLTYMMEDSKLVLPCFELISAARNLERVGDHSTNIAEDVIYIVAGRDVRHQAAASS